MSTFHKTTQQPPWSLHTNHDYRAEVNGYTLRILPPRDGVWRGLAHHGYQLQATAHEITRPTREQVENELLAWADGRTAPVDETGIAEIRRQLVSVLAGQDTVIAPDPTLRAVKDLLDAPSTEPSKTTVE